MEENASFNLSEFKCKYITFEDAINNEFDYVIATEWVSLYASKKLKGKHIYFVQDFEPYFYPYGDRYFLAKNSLELNETIISLGNWNKKEILKNCDKSNLGNIYCVDFPFEQKEYQYQIKDFKHMKEKKIVNLAVYIKREAKRCPALIMSLIYSTYKKLEEYGIKLNVEYFGLNPKEKVLCGNNNGRISKSEIRDIYSKCDFGMVASMTNVSLVPFEMIGAGLPVIEFEDGSATDFINPNNMILINFDYNRLVEKIIYYIDNPLELQVKTKNAFEEIKDLSWNKTGNQFYDILKGKN